MRQLSRSFARLVRIFLCLYTLGIPYQGSIYLCLHTLGIPYQGSIHYLSIYSGHTIPGQHIPFIYILWAYHTRVAYTICLYTLGIPYQGSIYHLSIYSGHTIRGQLYFYNQWMYYPPQETFTRPIIFNYPVKNRLNCLYNIRLQSIF